MPAVVPELLMRKLSLLRTDDLCEPEFTKQDSAPFSGGENEDEVLDDVAKRYQMSRGGMELKAHEQITDLLHAFVGHEEFRRLNAAASVQQTLLHELVQVHEEQDRDMDVWNEAQRHAVAQILEGGPESKELANVPVSAMQRLLNNRGYELPEPQKAQNLCRGLVCARALSAQLVQGEASFPIRGSCAAGYIPGSFRFAFSSQCRHRSSGCEARQCSCRLRDITALHSSSGHLRLQHISLCPWLPIRKQQRKLALII